MDQKNLRGKRNKLKAKIHKNSNSLARDRKKKRKESQLNTILARWKSNYSIKIERMRPITKR